MKRHINLEQLSVVHLYGLRHIPSYDDADKKETKRQWESHCPHFAPSTCMRTVFITTANYLQDHPFPESVQASKKDILTGKEAYEFLLQWTSGILHMKGKEGHQQPDHRVRHEFLTQWEHFFEVHTQQTDTPSKEVMEPLIHTLYPVVQMVLQDVTQIKRIWSDTSITQGRPEETLIAATYSACERCAASRAEGKLPLYDMMESTDHSIYDRILEERANMRHQHALEQHADISKKRSTQDRLLPSFFTARGPERGFAQELAKAIDARYQLDTTLGKRGRRYLAEEEYQVQR